MGKVQQVSPSVSTLLTRLFRTSRDGVRAGCQLHWKSKGVCAQTLPATHSLEWACYSATTWCQPWKYENTWRAMELGFFSGACAQTVPTHTRAVNGLAIAPPPGVKPGSLRSHGAPVSFKGCAERLYPHTHTVNGLDTAPPLGVSPGSLTTHGELWSYCIFQGCAERLYPHTHTVNGLLIAPPPGVSPGSLTTHGELWSSCIF